MFKSSCRLSARFYRCSWGHLAPKPTYSLEFIVYNLVYNLSERSNLRSKISWYSPYYVWLFNEKVSQPRGIFLISGAELHTACLSAVIESKAALDQLEAYV